MSKITNTEIRIAGASLVNELKPVLNDLEYIDYMATAVNLYSNRVLLLKQDVDELNTELGKDREYKTVADAIFGDTYGSLLVRTQDKQQREEIITDTSMPVKMRIFFIDNMSNLDDWRKFKEDFGVYEESEEVLVNESPY